MPPVFWRMIRLAVAGLGAVTVMVAGVNIVATWALIGPFEEEQLGITRAEMVTWYVTSGLLGLGLLTVVLFVEIRGWRKRRRAGRIGSASRHPGNAGQAGPHGHGI